MILTSATEIYKAFLNGISHTETNIVHPQVFSRIWNIWSLTEWVTENTSLKEGVDLTLKQIDDLQMLNRMVILKPTSNQIFRLPDGGTEYNGYAITFNPSEISSSESEYFASDQYPFPTGDPTSLDKYVRAVRVSFRLEYASDQECGLTGYSDWTDAKLLKSNQKPVIMSSVYRKPKDDRLYYEVSNGQIICRTGGSQAIYMFLEYYKYPNYITYNEEDESLSYTIDLNQEQLKEVLDKAIVHYFKRVNDPRYKTFFDKELMSQSTKI